MTMSKPLYSSLEAFISFLNQPAKKFKNITCPSGKWSIKSTCLKKKSTHSRLAGMHFFPHYTLVIFFCIHWLYCSVMLFDWNSTSITASSFITHIGNENDQILSSNTEQCTWPVNLSSYFSQSPCSLLYHYWASSWSNKLATLWWFQFLFYPRYWLNLLFQKQNHLKVNITPLVFSPLVLSGSRRLKVLPWNF